MCQTKWEKQVKTYQLYVKVARVWTWVSTITAPDHATALRQAIASIPAEHYDKAIRIEQEDEPEWREPLE